MAVAQYLVDKSVLMRVGKLAIREQLLQLSDRGLLATCAIVEMEMLFSARSPANRDQIRGSLSNFEWLPMPDEIWQRATQVQCELVNTAHHRSVKIPDLLIAATAERYQLEVLHYDHDFDVIAEFTGQSARWVVPAGDAD